MHIDGNTALLGLVGNPVAHSYSPYLHNSVLKKLGINAVYVPLLSEPQRLLQAVEAIRALNFRGVNVTIPFKERVIPFLDATEGDAAHCGAVNVIENRSGRLVGHNTDGQGFLSALRDNRLPFDGKAVLIGAGGAARSVAYALARSGFDEIVLLDTDINRASGLADFLNRQASCSSYGALMNHENFQQNARDAALLVNCSPVGMHPRVNDSPVNDLSFMAPGAAICDLIYNPLQTRFLDMGLRRGLKTINGLSMFVHQAALTLEIVLGIDPPVQLMKEVMAGAIK